MADRDARLLLASLTAPKFAGRAALLRLAEGLGPHHPPDDTALDALEMTPRQREIALVRGELSDEVAQIFSKNPFYQHALRVRRDRAHLRKSPRYVGYRQGRYVGWVEDDPLSKRPTGEALKRTVLEIFDRSLRRAYFRRTFAHETKVEYVSSGGGVSSESGLAWTRGSMRHRYPDAWSEHRWKVSPEILKVPAMREDGARWDGKYLWLTPSTRVRQGRGSHLVVEYVRRRR